MQLENLNISHAGEHYVGFTFIELPLDAARQAAVVQIDAAANQARVAVVGDPLRAFEYQLAETEARRFTEQSYQGEAPRAVRAWAMASGISDQQAAQAILEKASAWITALHVIRETRLLAKQAVFKADSHVEVQSIADKALVSFPSMPLDI
ncbi:hypothetical protein [Pseudomonas carassii]|uniref:Uncharacterized protein n=1 Tax=Pseudomonas carassii TaxID=3115855 RepID=A0ABU7HD27_9PSED|nr:hypothetical protein [Pseudomonas sp. 137P]MEE1888496.1 hypothetical protein [Pseudomonas sp. 137P]